MAVIDYGYSPEIGKMETITGAITQAMQQITSTLFQLLPTIIVIGVLIALIVAFVNILKSES